MELKEQRLADRMADLKMAQTVIATEIEILEREQLNVSQESLDLKEKNVLKGSCVHCGKIHGGKCPEYAGF